jgi:hypothetical protein
MSSFEVSRSTTIAVDAARVHTLINDFHEWRKWSPWEEIDPHLARNYSGPEKGVGARYAWEGNRKAGHGAMEITGSTPDRIDVGLRFIKPFKAENEVAFTLTATPVGTEVCWTATGDQKGIAAVLSKLVSIDKLLGKDFEKGLARLKAAAES